jgi:hypothetical protein
MEPARPAERHVLHFDRALLGGVDESLTFHVAGDEYPLLCHTSATRAEAQRDNPMLGLYADDVTHYAEVDLPSDAIVMTYVTRRIEVDGFPCDAAIALCIHVPRKGRQREAAEAMRKNAGTAELHPKLALRADTQPSAALAAQAMQRPDLLHDIFDPYETAAALLYQHPSLINLSVENGGTVPSVILHQCIGRAFTRSSTLVDRIKERGPNWVAHLRLKDGDEFLVDENGAPYFTTEIHRSVRRAMTDPLSLALRYSQQLAELEGQTWTVQYGVASENDPAAATARDGETKWTTKAHSSQWGVSFDRVDYSEPVAGGWTVDAIWSHDSKPKPMDGEFVNALAAGRAFLSVDVESRHDRVLLPAQQLEPDMEATFRAHLLGLAATIVLDPLHTDLFVVVQREREFAGVKRIAAIHLGILRGDGNYEVLWSHNGPREDRGEIRVTARNAKLRHLSAYAEFFDRDGKAIEPGDLTWLPNALRSVIDKHKTKRFVDVIAPINSVFGFPVRPDPVTLHIPFPKNAANMRLYWGGLGVGRYDEQICALGIALTTSLELALPVILLVIGAALYRGSLVRDLLTDKMTWLSIAKLVGALTAGGGQIGRAQDPAKAAKQVAVTLAPMLVRDLGKQGNVKFAHWLAKRAGAGYLKRAIPFINKAFLALDAAVTAADLAQTTVAILQSPWYYDVEIARGFDLDVTVKPDPRFRQFPTHRDRMRVQLVHDTAGTTRHTERIDLPLSTPIEMTFADEPATGRIKVFVFFYAANGWQSGAGSSGWFDAKGENGMSRRRVEVTVNNAEIPLSVSSVYQHRQVIAIENGRHRWKAGPAPTETAATRPGDPSRQLFELNAISVAQRPGMIGYAWQASGLGPDGTRRLFVVQNLSLLEDPSSRYASIPVGFTARSGISYDLTSEDDGSGMSFFIDPSRGQFDPEDNPAGGYHLRKVALSSNATPRFEVGSGKSWGRFPQAMNSFVVTAGHVAAITDNASKIFVLRLPPAAVDDADATMASLASGDGARDGLMLHPRAIAVALDGRLLVLEQPDERGLGRIQCFDVVGNPVPYFRPRDGGELTPVLPLRNADTTKFLDLSVEAKGYIFVLGHSGDGATATQYRVDVYEPDGAFLVSTPGVAAAKIAVDLARSMFTLNWQTLRGPGGRTEPSVSLWVPPPPDNLGGTES